MEIRFGDPSPYAPNYQHRAMAFGRNGAVASSSTLAAATGLKILQSGGNAVDAAIAIAAVETVVISMMCGLGGEAFAIVTTPDGRSQALNGSGAAPAAIDAENYRRQGLHVLPLAGAESAAVPGEVDAYETLHQAFGSLPFAQLLQPAIDYAEHGHPADQRNVARLARLVPLFQRIPETARVYLPDGEAPKPGQMVVLPDLAATLKEVAQGGAEAFYRGPLARRLVEGLQQGGGVHTAADFAAHHASLYEPLRTAYRGYEILETAPVSQGLIVLEALNLLSGWDIARLGPLSPELIHLQVEALRLATADRNAYLGDPAIVKPPVEQLMSQAYADKRRKDIDPRRAGPAVPGQPFDADGTTTSFVVADGSGMCVSFIHSISAIGGSGFVAPGTGVLFNNRVSRGFTLEPGHPNELAGGKRTMHTLNCYQIHQHGRPLYLGGTPGGDGQPQWNVQVIQDLLDFGMNVQQAAEWPRWMYTPATDPAMLRDAPRLELDGRYPPELASALREMGHPVHRVEPWDPGRLESGVQLIRIDPETGVMATGSDARNAGLGIAF